MDYRAWRALHWILGTYEQFDIYSSYGSFLNLYQAWTPESYLDYVEDIRGLAAKNDMTPRTIEMGLWKFDKDNEIN